MARSDRSGAESANSANVRNSALAVSPPTPPILLAGGVGDIGGRVELADPRGGCTSQFRQFVPAGCITPRPWRRPDDGDERKDRHEAPPTVAEAHARSAGATMPDPWTLVFSRLAGGVAHAPLPDLARAGRVHLISDAVPPGWEGCDSAPAPAPRPARRRRGGVTGQLVQMTVTLSAAAARKLKRLGGSAWLDRYMDEQAPPPI